jgi:uncharacterized protein (DUF1501 family)
MMTPDDHQQIPNAPIDIAGRHSRRQFLGRLGLLAGAGAVAPWALDLGAMASASTAAAAAPAANAATDDYRALVCLFLYGGNDQWNTFIPDDTVGFQAYQQARNGIARARDEILPLSPSGGFDGAGRFGFAPELHRLHALFGSGQAAVVANVGTLLEPIDKAAYSDSGKRPPLLFSHNDQQSFWQAGALEGARHGWGGRIADFLLDDNGANALFTSVSVSGNAVMMSGRDALQYQVSSRGVTTLRTDAFQSDSLNDGLMDILSRRRNGLIPRAYTDVSRRAVGAASDLSDAIDAATAGLDLAPFFATPNPSAPVNNLRAQLETVARLIAAGRKELGLKRQVFFVGLAGFDTHSRLVPEHSQLLDALDVGLAGFHAAMASMGLGDRVTSFTASDFGRTLVSNGDGSDHGWGGHHLVVGGAVRGNRVVGTLPTVANDGPDDVGQGRLLPTISVDQYAATLGRWLGVQDNDLNAIVPNLGNFSVRDLGLF